MPRHIEHKLLAPDGTPLVTIAKERVLNGETIQAFIRRNDWHFSLPTRCFVNGVVIRPEQLQWHRIRRSDRIVIMSRPGNFGRGGGSTAKSIGAIVGMVALTILAPYAGGAIAGALGVGSATLFGVSYSSIIAGFVIGAGSFLLSQFLKPKPAKSQAASDPIYSLTASGNQAKPLGMIPVGYGRRFRQPEYGAPPFSVFEGDDQRLYQLFCIGAGIYSLDVIYLDDIPIWTKETGFDPNFADVAMEWVLPGQDVTFFPVNITSASEVTGNQLPSPSKDPVRNGWVGPYIASPPDSEAKELWFDLQWPGGAVVNFKGRQMARLIDIEFQLRKVDAAGVPIGGPNAPWVPLGTKNYSINRTRAYRVTERFPVDGGRWQARVRRVGDSMADSTLPENTSGQDDVVWTAFRALLDGPQSFPKVTMLALVFKADATMSAGQQNRVGVVASRKIESYRNGVWQLIETRNPVDAAIDMWRNGDYSAGLSANYLVLQDLIYQRDMAEARGDAFDHYFEDAVSLQDALETALRVIRANPAFIGDRLSIVRDEPKVPRMLFTDAEIVRGSLTITRSLLDETWADGVEVTYFDERNWRPASVKSAPGLVRPARVEMPGVGKRDKATGLARHMAAVNRYRRRKASFQTELEGRLLKRGDLVLVQSELPQNWGKGGELRGYDASSSPLRLTLDQALTLPASKSHFLLLRRRNGRPWGPVKLLSNSTPSNVVRIDPADLTLVQSQQGNILTQVLNRPDTEDPPTYSYSEGAPREYRGLVVAAKMRDMLATIDTVIEAPQVYTADESDVPPIPQVPIIFTESTLPVISRIAARAFQRGAQLYVSVSWDPVRNAALYLAQLSLDDGEDWGEVYRDASSAFEVPIGGASVVKVRVACITITGLLCRFVETSCPVPPLQLTGDFFQQIEILIEHLDEQTRQEIRSIATTGQGGIRDAIKAVDDKLQQLAADVATIQESNYRARQLLKIAAGENFAAIERVDTLRLSDKEAFAETTTALGARLLDAEDQIDSQSGAIFGLQTSVTNLGGSLTAQSQQITQLSSRIDDAVGSIGGQATAVQQLQTRVTEVDGQISAQTRSLTALSTTVDGHTSTLTQYGTSIDGILAQYGVAIEIDGQTGGYVLKGVREPSGSVSFQLLIDADVFARSITTPRIQAMEIIVNSAQIGNLVVGTSNIQNQAVSQTYFALANPGKTASIPIATRAGARVIALGIFNGDIATAFAGTAANGLLEIHRNGAAFAQLFPSIVSVPLQSGQITKYFVAQPILKDDLPPAGQHTYSVVSTYPGNGSNTSVSICLFVLDK